MTWTTIRAIRTKRFAVLLQWEPEQDSDISWMDDDGRARLRSGEWINCCFRVAVFLDGRMIATDYLGNSVYEDPADFAEEHYGHNHDLGRAYFPDMLREAVGQARLFVSLLPAPPRVRLDTNIMA